MQAIKDIKRNQNADTWISALMHCPNCGQINVGYKNAEGKVRYECRMCKVVLVRTPKGRRHDTIEMYAPEGEQRLY